MKSFSLKWLKNWPKIFKKRHNISIIGNCEVNKNSKLWRNSFWKFHKVELWTLNAKTRRLPLWRSYAGSGGRIFLVVIAGCNQLVIKLNHLKSVQIHIHRITYQSHAIINYLLWPDSRYSSKTIKAQLLSIIYYHWQQVYFNQLSFIKSLKYIFSIITAVPTAPTTALAKFVQNPTGNKFSQTGSELPKIR